MKSHYILATGTIAALLTATPVFADSDHHGLLNFGFSGGAKVHVGDGKQSDAKSYDSIGIGAKVRELAQAQNASTSGIGGFVKSLAQDFNRHDKDKNEHATTTQANITGTITAISGTILTVSGQNGAVYTVNAGSAAIKDGTFADLKINDKVTVAGTLSGPVITATKIYDRTDDKIAISGTVTAINGAAITLTGKNNAVYTVNAGSASVSGGLSNVKVGDTVSVRGSLSGSVITATSVVDKPFLQRAVAAANSLRAGIVSAVTGNGFTLNGSTSVTTNGSTTVLTKGGATSTAAIGLGSKVLVLGTSSATTSTSTPDTITASIVILFQNGMHFLKHLFFLR